MSQQQPIASEETAPDPITIGRAGWTILHTTAAAFPNRPTPAQKKDFINFIQSWSNVYPCSVCGYHMRMLLKKMPIQADSKRDASKFVCELHSKVNEMLGRPPSNCDPDVVLRRWHPTYPDMEDEPPIEEQLAAQQQQTKPSSRSTGPFGFSVGNSAPRSALATPSTDEEINEIIRKLKPCRAFCPEKKM